MGQVLSEPERDTRNARLVRDRLQHGFTWEQLGKRYEITGRQCRNIVRAYLGDGEHLPEQDYAEPTKVVDKLLAGYESDVWELTEAANLAWQQNSPAVVVGAVKARMDARQRIIELLQATNRLPRNLGHLSVIYDVRFLVEQVVEVFAEHDVPPEARRALMERLGPVVEGMPPEPPS